MALSKLHPLSLLKYSQIILLWLSLKPVKNVSSSPSNDVKRFWATTEEFEDVHLYVERLNRSVVGDGVDWYKPFVRFEFKNTLTITIEGEMVIPKMSYKIFFFQRNKSFTFREVLRDTCYKGNVVCMFYSSSDFEFEDLCCEKEEEGVLIHDYLRYSKGKLSGYNEEKNLEEIDWLEIDFGLSGLFEREGIYYFSKIKISDVKLSVPDAFFVDKDLQIKEETQEDSQFFEKMEASIPKHKLKSS